MIEITRRSALCAGASAILPFIGISGLHAKASGSLTFGISSFAPPNQPWMQVGISTVKVLIFRGLTSYAPDGTIRGELAESWSSENLTTWVFKLREAFFHNGEKVTSADVKWSFEQIASEKSSAFFRKEMQGIEHIDTPDDRTVRVVMKQPNVTFPELMASPHMGILWRGSRVDAPVGAGPFVVTGQERGASIDLEAFSKFYKPGLPKINKLRLVVYADENLRVAALLSGDVDLIEYVPWPAMETIEGRSNLKLDSNLGPFMYLVFNASKPPFDNPKVRKAVAHAINRDEIVKGAFFGRGAPLTHLPITETSEFFSPDLSNGWAYDPALAKKLLGEAGFADGFGCNLLSSAQYGMHRSTAEIVQQHLAAVGIKATLSMPDWATRVSIGNRGQYDIAVSGTAADNNDPDGLASYIDPSLSPSYVRSIGLKIERITQLLKQGRSEFELAKRKIIYRELEKTVIEEAPIVGLAWRSQGFAMSRSVTGFVNLPGALTFYSPLSLESVQK